MKFEERLKELMKMKGFTQKELAQRSNITESSMSKYLSGERTPRIDVIRNLSLALGVSIDTLIDNEEGDSIKLKTDFKIVSDLLSRGSSEWTEQQKMDLINILSRK